MASFVEKCNCRGMSVKGVLGTQHNLRPDITGRLLQERHVARYLVAPVGYGKSTVAYEYAQIVFGFMHTFWFKCPSPCFIRDLDEGVLSDQILRCDPHAALVVFEDVPHLDPERAVAFDGVLRTLIDAGVEVISTCTPAADTFTALMPDRVTLKAADLLLSDEEVSVERLRGNLAGSEGDGLSAADRAACLVWDAAGASVLLKGFRREDLPSEVRLVALLVLLFAEGGLADFESVFRGTRLVEDVAFLEESYPFLGIDCAAGSFESVAVAVSDMARSLGFPMEELAIAAAMDSASLCAWVADRLLERGQSVRAADFMRLVPNKAASARWLAARGWPVMLDLEPLAVENLFDPLRRYAAENAERMCAIGAWASYALEDAEGVRRRCRSVVRSAKANWRDVTACLMVRAMATGAFCADGHSSDLDRVVKLRRMETVAAPDGVWADDPVDWNCLLELMLAHNAGEEALREAWEDLAEEADSAARTTRAGGAPRAGSCARRDALLLFGAWWMRRTADAPAADAPAAGDPTADATAVCGPLLGAMGAFAVGRITGDEAPSVPRWVRMTVGRALLKCADALPGDFGLTLPQRTENEIRQMEAYLSSQAKDLRRMKERAERAKEEYIASHPDPFRAVRPIASKGRPVRSNTPVLKIDMFGGFDVHVEDDACKPCRFRRKKAKLALAMLAIGRGREISRSRLTEILWPDSDDDFCRRNFYVIWGSLKKELTVDGTCPYLLRSQTGYRLDPRFVATDLDAFDRLCRSLLFGGDDVVSWEEAFEQVTHDFSEDFLPDVEDNEFVVELRMRYKDQLIDGLISASARLAALGEPRGSLWFAREALRRNELREDSYISLMKAQIASSQRGAALETYFTCRRMLTEKLGIDPSPNVMELYNSIIESEESF